MEIITPTLSETISFFVAGKEDKRRRFITREPEVVLPFNLDIYVMTREDNSSKGFRLEEVLEQCRGKPLFISEDQHGNYRIIEIMNRIFDLSPERNLFFLEFLPPELEGRSFEEAREILKESEVLGYSVSLEYFEKLSALKKRWKDESDIQVFSLDSFRKNTGMAHYIFEKAGENTNIVVVAGNLHYRRPLGIIDSYITYMGLNNSTQSIPLLYLSRDI